MPYVCRVKQTKQPHAMNARTKLQILNSVFNHIVKDLEPFRDKESAGQLIEGDPLVDAISDAAMDAYRLNYPPAQNRNK